MKNILRVIIAVLIFNLQFSITHAQIAINEDGSSPDASAMLEITSSEKGILIPRMTTSERTTISSPATGLLVYDTDFNSFWYYANSTWNNLSQAEFADADNDTKIQVEESADEDIIRFDLGGTEFMSLDNGRLEFHNTGNSVFIGEDAGKNDHFSNANVFIGNDAGKSNTTGYNSVAIGRYALQNATTAYENVALGYGAGRNLTTGRRNVSLGFGALENNEEGYANVVLGYNAGKAVNLHNKSFNVLIGHNAAKFLEADANTIIGYEAGLNTTSGTQNVFLGYQAGYNETGSNKLYIENSDADSANALIYGEFDNDLLQINGTLNINGNYDFPIIDGAGGQILTTDGSGSVYWSDISATVSLSDSDNDTKIQVEESSDEDIIRFDIAGTEFMRLDNGRIEITNTGNSIFIGEGAGANDDYSANKNVFIGRQAGNSNTSGYSNIFMGQQAGTANDTGYQNVMIGEEAGEDNTTGSTNVFVGHRAGFANDTGDNNLFLGYQSGYTNVSGNTNVFLGYKAGYFEMGSNKLYIENSSESSPLIYGDFDTDILELNGSVGVGTTPTNGKFEVSGEGNALASYTYGYLNDSGTTGTWTSAPAYSIYADGRIGGLSFHAHSDERIKNIEGISNSREDLNTLMNIEITNYTLKDKISKSNGTTKKVIAQQVKSVYPQAVSTHTTQVIPDIYQTATIDENGWINLSTDLKTGELIQIIFDDKKELLEVLETKEDAFQIKPSTMLPRLSTVFVYGKQVNDFHTVDYEAISMLNVSATQQLVKEVEALKRRNIELEVQLQKVNQLEETLQRLQTQLGNQ